MDNEGREQLDISKIEKLGITKSEIIHQLLSMVDSVNQNFTEARVFSEFKNPIRIKSQVNNKFYFTLEIGKLS